MNNLHIRESELNILRSTVDLLVLVSDGDYRRYVWVNRRFYTRLRVLLSTRLRRMTQTNVQRFLGMTITGSKSLRLTKIVYSFMIISEHARFMEHTNLHWVMYVSVVCQLGLFCDRKIGGDKWLFKCATSLQYFLNRDCAACTKLAFCGFIKLIWDFLGKPILWLLKTAC